MALCSRCGVDVGTALLCPLCNASISLDTSVDTTAASPQSPPPRDESITTSPTIGEAPGFYFFVQAPRTPQEVRDDKRRRVIGMEVLSVSIGIVIFTILGIDLILTQGLSWSPVVLASLIFVWSLVAFPLLFWRKPLLLWLTLALAPYLFLLSLEWLRSQPGSLLPLMLPIVVAVEVSIAAAVTASRLARRRGLNVVAFCLLAASAVCMAVEFAVRNYRGLPIVLEWSSIVAFAAVPAASFLIYFHHRVATTTTLRKLFHL